MKIQEFFKKKSRRHKILAVSIAAILLISAFPVYSFATEKNASKERETTKHILGSSELENSPSVPGSDPSQEGVSGELAEKTKDYSLLFQFREKGEDENPSLELALVGAVSQVVMTAPKGDLTEKEVPQSADPILGASSLSDRAARVSTVSTYSYQLVENSQSNPVDREETTITTNVVLGYSENSIAEIPSNVTLETDSVVSFAVPEEGVYLFDLYGAQEEWIAQLSYRRGTRAAGDLVLSTVLGDNFKIVADTKLRVQYTPRGSGEEKLTITLPPFFELLGMPQEANQGVEYSETETALPVEHYQSDPMGGILLTQNASKPNLYRTKVLEVKIAATVAEELILTFDIGFKDPVNLSALMVAYGADPDKIPLKVIAEVFDVTSSARIKTEIIHGTSVLTDSTGQTPVDNQLRITKPTRPTVYYSSGYGSDEVSVFDKNEGDYFHIDKYHYPYTELAFYHKYFQGIKPINNADVTETIVQIGTVDYIKRVVDYTEYGQFDLLSRFPRNYTTRFGILDTLKPGDEYDVGSVYVQYTHKGVQSEYIEVMDQGKVIIPDYFNIFRAMRFPNGVEYKEWEEFPQGATGQAYNFTYQNSKGGAITNNLPVGEYLPPVYEDITYTLEFPYEVFPTSITLPAAGGSKATQLKYTTHIGGEHILPIPGSGITPLPQENGHITKLEVLYPLLPSNRSINLWVTASHSETDRSGQPLPAKHPVSIKSSIKTETGNRTEQYGLLTPNHSPMDPTDFTDTYNYYLIGKEDGLRFGTSGTTAHPSLGKNTDRLVLKEGSTAIELAKPEWEFGFISSETSTKDYDNVVIKIEPKTPADLKGMSKVRGVRSYAVTPAQNNLSSKYEAYYTTNLSVQPQQAAPQGAGLVFSLLPGEFPTSIEIHLGTLRGDKIPKGNPGYDNDERIFNPGGAPMFFLFYNADHYYYSGDSALQEAVKNGDQASFVATASTSSEAKYIKPGGTFTGTDPDYKNNTSTSVLDLITYRDLTVKFSWLMTQSWKNADNTLNPNKVYYQNSVATFELYTAFNYSLDGKDSQTSLFDLYSSADHSLYLEVEEGFEIMSISGYTHVSTTPLAGKTSKQVVYALIPGTKVTTKIPVYDPVTQVNEVGMVSLYVLPDAPVVTGTRPVISNIGISFDKFIDGHMVPSSGDNAYYLSAPHHKVSFSRTWQQKLFPLYWDQAALQHQLLFQVLELASSDFSISVNQESLDRITLNPLVDGILNQKEAKFKDHQRKSLTAYGWMKNVAGSQIDSYRAVYYLPREGKQTQGLMDAGAPTMHLNDYSLYLTGPVSFGSDVPSVLQPFVYRNEAGVELTLTTSSTPAEWREVAQIEVVFDDFLEDETFRLDMPLEADSVKKGSNVNDLSAYLGATSSKNFGGGFAEPSFTDPARFVFESYSMDIQVGLDTDESGARASLLPDKASVNVYYNDASGTEQVLYTSTVGATHSVPMNPDATRVEIIPLTPTEYKLTQQNALGVGGDVDSDLSRTTNSKDIVLQDLIKKTAHQYDANLIRLATGTIPLITLSPDATENAAPNIQFVVGGTDPLFSSYTYDYSQTMNPSIATMSPTGTATGVKKGTTTYTLTVTNTLGDVVTITGTITVVPSIVPTATLSKKLASGSRNTGAGTFDFAYWAEDSAAADLGESAATTVTGLAIDSTVPVANLEHDTVHYIREITTSTSYEIDNFVVKADGAALTVTNNSGLFSFTIPKTAASVTIEAVNKNIFSSMTVKKVLAQGTVDIKPNQLYPVEITEQGTRHSIYSSSLKTDGVSGTSSEFILGMTYYISETVPAGYELKRVTILNASGVPTTVQPTSVDNKTYSFVFGAEHKNGTITVENSVLTGNGLTLTKALEATNLPLEPFEFTLSGDTGLDLYGFINSPSYPAQVNWFMDSTMATSYTDSKLPYGKYTLTETSSNTNFVLDEFIMTAGTADPTSTPKSMVFTVSDTSGQYAITANNQAKRTGSVEVIKSADVSVFATDTMTFTLTHQPSGQTYTSTSVVSTTGQSFAVWTKTGAGTTHQTDLPLGEYTLTETDSGAHFDFQGFAAQTGVTLSPDKKTATFTLSEVVGAQKAISLEASNVLKNGKVTVSKQVSGIILGGTQTFVFEVYSGVSSGGIYPLVDTITITVVDSDPGQKKTGQSKDLPYGNYFAVEKDHGEYKLITTASTVLEQGDGRDPVDHLELLESSTGSSFVAVNTLKTTTQGLIVRKSALDAAEVSSTETFTFGIYNVKRQLLYNGSIQSDATGMTSTAGAGIVWTRNGTHTNGEVDPSGSTITGLEYGTYSVKELAYGTLFRPKGVRSTTGLGNVVSSTEYSFDINAATEALADNVITFTNERSFVKTATITKDFAAGSSNIRGKTFTFKYWRTSIGISDTIQVGSVDEKGTQTMVLEKGEDYRITEVAMPAGYKLDGFTITTNDPAMPDVTVTKSGTSYLFTVPRDATEVTITAINSNVTSTMSVKKTLESGSPNLIPTQVYPISIAEKGTSTPLFTDDTIKMGETRNAHNFVEGLTYVVTETVPTDYKLTNIAIVDPVTGDAVGAQPSRNGAAEFEFIFEAAQEDAVILVTNAMRVGNGLTLTKALEATNLPKENFTFELTGPSGFKAFGRVDNTVPSYPASATWYSDSSHTTPYPGGVGTLPIGSYSFSETSNNINFDFSAFTVTAGSATVTGNQVKFTVTDGAGASVPVKVTAKNIVRSTGGVQVTKTFDASAFTGDIFKFTLTHKPSNKEYTAEHTVTAGGSTSVVFASWKEAGGAGTAFQGNLPLGEYTLTETNVGTHFEWAGFGADSTGYITLSGDKKTANFTLSADPAKKNTVSLSGHNTLAKGKIVITKHVNGGLAGLPSRRFTFDVYEMVAGVPTLVDANGSGVAGKSVFVDYTTADVGNPVTVDTVDLPYGNYYVEEHLDAMYYLLPSSEVTEPGAPPTVKLLDGTVGFVATNRLKTANNNLIVYKTADYATGFSPNKFIYELTDDSDLVLYKGEVASNATGIGSGAKVVWTKFGTHNNGSLDGSGTEIEQLIYGTYRVKETIAGSEYSLRTVQGRLGLGRASGTNGWELTLNTTTDLLSELAIDFVNSLHAKGGVSVKKIFTNNENPFPGTVFTFVLENKDSGVKYTGTTEGTLPVTAWTRVSDKVVVPNGTLPYGSYRVTETADPNYTLQKFTDLLPPAAGTLTATSADIVLSNANQRVEVSGENRGKTTGNITVNKVFENGYNYSDASVFTFQIYGPANHGIMPTIVRDTITVNKAGNFTGAFANLPYGEYRVVEDLTGMNDYEFVSASDGTTVVTSTDGTVKSLQLILGEKAGQTPSSNVSVMNRVASNASIKITKNVDGDHALGSQEFRFKITNQMNKEVKEVLVKANTSLVVDKLYFGTYQVEEVPDANYDLLGYGGAIDALTAAPPIVSVTGANPTGEVTAFNRVKRDGELTISPELIPDLVAIDSEKEFRFLIEESIDGGVTWRTPSGIGFGEVVLALKETHTYTGLMRGALYRVKTNRNVTSGYALVDIQANVTVGAIINIPDETFTFQPLEGQTQSTAVFVYDMKRMDVIIDKYSTESITYKVEGATFTLGQQTATNGRVVLQHLITDKSGKAVFGGLTSGDYSIYEMIAPSYYAILQKYIIITISMDMTTGNLQMTLNGQGKHVTATDNVLHVPNEYNPPDYTGTDVPDKNAPPPINKIKVLSEPQDSEHIEVLSSSIAKLPNAGGLSIAFLAVPGVVFLAVGLLIRKKRKKDEEEI